MKGLTMFKIVTNHYRSNVRNEILGVKSKAEAIQMAWDIVGVYDNGVYEWVQVHDSQWRGSIENMVAVVVEVVESNEVLLQP